VAEGVLPPPRKLNRTRAAYSTRHVRILLVIKRMQVAGYTLAQVRAFMQRMGTDDAALKKMEGIGSIMPLPAPRNDPDQKPIERFPPVARPGFLAMLPPSTPPTLVDDLERIGLLRPHAGKYDASDLWLVRNVLAMMADGVSMTDIEGLVPLVGIARHVSPLVARTLLSRRDEVMRRELRFRDVVRPYLDMTGYLLHRALHEDPSPAWNDLFRFDGIER
jgi:hypothetical protein